MLLGRRLSPMTKRGNVCFSTIRTLKPSRCSKEAATAPAGPAPMISTSVSLCVIIMRQTLLLRLFGLQQGCHPDYIIGQGPVTLQSGCNAPDEIIKLAV